MANPVVAIVGRPNVGKSTIFNRIAGQRISIVEDIPGVTRDRIYAKSEWMGQKFNMIDTGGIDIGDEPFVTQITEQAQIAIEEADVIVFLVSAKEGVTDADEKVARILYQTDKPVILAVNKVDNPELRAEIYDFYSLGFGDPVPVSGTHGIGTGDLLDLICKAFPKREAVTEDQTVKFSFIGRPNVGKSSLVNAILGENRVIVSNIEGTTRDAIDTKFVTEDDTEFTMIDTAGIRKKGKVYESTEKYSVLRALQAIDRSDVVCVVLNAEEGIREQDKHVAGYAHEAGRGIIIVVNKWDTIQDKDKSMKHWKEEMKYQFSFIPYAKVVFLSALTKKRIHTLMPEIIQANENAHRQISTSSLNNVITDAYALNLPPSYKGKRLKIYFSHQSNICPPTFNISVNSKGLIHFSYQRYLENKIRENFDFTGTPIKLNFKNKGEQ